MDLKINSEILSFKKTLKFLLDQIEEENHNFKIKFKKFIEVEADTPSLEIYFSKWIC